MLTAYTEYVAAKSTAQPDAASIVAIPEQRFDSVAAAAGGP